MKYTQIIVLIAGFGLCTCLRIKRQGGGFFNQQRCLTPLNENGICIGIKQCPVLVDLLVNQRHKYEVVNYLRSSVCGYENLDPKVCCPGLEGNAGSEETPAPPFRTPPPPTRTPPPRTTSTTWRPSVFKDQGRDDVFSDEDVDDDEGRLNSIIPQPGECGDVAQNNLKVVGGSNATLGEWPWVVALGYRSTKNTQSSSPVFLCGGSLITNRHILTAAHCVHNKKNLYMARIGDLDLYTDKDGAKPVDIPITSKIVHEDYNPTSFTNDIAILKLRSPVQYTENIRPICLPLSREMRSRDFSNRQPFIAGWGTLSFSGPSSSILQKVQLPVVTEPECKKAFSTFKTAVIDRKVICAGYLQGGKDACRGDSGGPLMDFDSKNAAFYQIGVVSYGYKCAEKGFPGVYTRVTSFADWILQKIS